MTALRPNFVFRGLATMRPSPFFIISSSHRQTGGLTRAGFTAAFWLAWPLAARRWRPPGRGDRLLGTGDTTSARLCYERAADGGSGLAALRLGATFDPALPRRTGMGTAADPAQALFWYRRARDLGITEAETRINRIENRKGAMSDALSR